MIQHDLNQFGAPSLQHNVQCLDHTSGCTLALYRLDLQQSTAYVSDFMLFGPTGSTPPDYYRNDFLLQMHNHPPKVLVITNAWLGETNSFNKLDRWPKFEEYLNAAYALKSEGCVGSCAMLNQPAYRLYVLRGSTK